MGRGRKLDLSFDSLKEGWEVDALCRTCGENRSECICKKGVETLPPSRHRLVVKTQMRRGKPVTLAGEFFIGDGEAKELLGRIKKRLGCGGTFKAGWLQVQGKRVEELQTLLKEEGFYS